MSARWLRHPVRAVLDWLGGWLAVRAWKSAAREQRRAQAEDRHHRQELA